MSYGEGALAPIYARGDIGVVLVTTGGGTSAVGWYHAVPGASRVMLDSRVPYSREAVEEMVGPVEKSVSRDTAQALASWAYLRALSLLPKSPSTLIDSNRRAVGIACTAALRTDRERRGDDHAWLATTTREETCVWRVDLSRWATREAQEQQLSERLVVALYGPAERVRGVWPVRS